MIGLSKVEMLLVFLVGLTALVALTTVFGAAIYWFSTIASMS
jgi:hypothetical protein